MTESKNTTCWRSSIVWSLTLQMLDLFKLFLVRKLNCQFPMARFDDDPWEGGRKCRDLVLVALTFMSQSIIGEIDLYPPMSMKK